MSSLQLERVEEFAKTRVEQEPKPASEQKGRKERLRKALAPPCGSGPGLENTALSLTQGTKSFPECSAPHSASVGPGPRVAC